MDTAARIQSLAESESADWEAVLSTFGSGGPHEPQAFQDKFEALNPEERADLQNDLASCARLARRLQTMDTMRLAEEAASSAQASQQTGVSELSQASADGGGALVGDVNEFGMSQSSAGSEHSAARAPAANAEALAQLHQILNTHGADGAAENRDGDSPSDSESQNGDGAGQIPAHNQVDDDAEKLFDTQSQIEEHQLQEERSRQSSSADGDDVPKAQPRSKSRAPRRGDRPKDKKGIDAGAHSAITLAQAQGVERADQQQLHGPDVNPSEEWRQKMGSALDAMNAVSEAVVANSLPGRACPVRLNSAQPIPAWVPKNHALREDGVMECKKRVFVSPVAEGAVAAERPKFEALRTFLERGSVQESFQMLAVGETKKHTRMVGPFGADIKRLPKSRLHQEQVKTGAALPATEKFPLSVSAVDLVSVALRFTLENLDQLLGVEHGTIVGRAVLNSPDEPRDGAAVNDTHALFNACMQSLGKSGRELSGPESLQALLNAAGNDVCSDKEYADLRNRLKNIVYPKADPTIWRTPYAASGGGKPLVRGHTPEQIQETRTKMLGSPQPPERDAADEEVRGMSEREIMAAMGSHGILLPAFAAGSLFTSAAAGIKEVHKRGLVTASAAESPNPLCRTTDLPDRMNSILDALVAGNKVAFDMTSGISTTVSLPPGIKDVSGKAAQLDRRLFNARGFVDNRTHLLSKEEITELKSYLSGTDTRLNSLRMHKPALGQLAILNRNVAYARQMAPYSSSLFDFADDVVVPCTGMDALRPQVQVMPDTPFAPDELSQRVLASFSSCVVPAVRIGGTQQPRDSFKFITGVFTKLHDFSTGLERPPWRMCGDWDNAEKWNNAAEKVFADGQLSWALRDFLPRTPPQRNAGFVLLSAAPEDEPQGAKLFGPAIENAKDRGMPPAEVEFFSMNQEQAMKALIPNRTMSMLGMRAITRRSQLVFVPNQRTTSSSSTGRRTRRGKSKTRSRDKSTPQPEGDTAAAGAGAPAPLSSAAPAAHGGSVDEEGDTHLEGS